MSQSLAALGIRSEQILQESRALVTGNITEDAAAARILGISKAQIDQARQSGELFEFLSDRLAAFAEAGDAAATSYEVSLSNLEDATDAARAELTKPLFDALAVAYRDFTEQLRDESAVASIRTLGVQLGDVAGMAIGVTKGLLSLAPALTGLAVAGGGAAIGLLTANLATMVTGAGAATRAVTALRAAIMTLGLTNPFIAILTAITTIVALVWQWTAGQRAARDAAREHRESTDRMISDFDARIAALDSEAGRLELIAALREKINALEAKQKRTSSEERELALLKERVRMSQGITSDQLRAQREINRLEAARTEAMRRRQANIDALTAPETREAQLAALRSQRDALPQADVDALLAEARRFDTANTFEDRDALAAVVMENNRAARRGDIDINALEVRRSVAKLSALNALARRGQLPSREELEAQREANAVALQQARERMELTGEIAKLEAEIATERQAREAALAEASTEALQLQARAAETSFAEQAMSAQAYRDTRFAILDQLQARERAYITGTVQDAELRDARLKNLDERYRQERERIDDEIQTATERRLEQEWQAIEEHFQKQIAAIDALILEEQARGTPDAIARATALDKRRAALIKAAADEAGRLNAQLGSDAFVFVGGRSPLDTESPSALKQFATRMRTVAEDTSAAMAHVYDSMFGAVSAGFERMLLTGKVTWAGLAQVGQGVMAAIIRQISEMAAAWVTSHVIMRGESEVWQGLSSAWRARDVAETTAAESAKAAAATPAATLVSISSFGSAAFIGLAAVGAALAAAAALGAFAEGGYTGSGGKHDVAGVVHRGEYVIPADVVAGAGLAQVEAMVAGLGGGVPGMVPASTVQATGMARAGSRQDAPAAQIFVVGSLAEAESLAADLPGNVDIRVQNAIRRFRA